MPPAMLPKETVVSPTMRRQLFGVAAQASDSVTPAAMQRLDSSIRTELRVPAEERTLPGPRHL